MTSKTTLQIIEQLKETSHPPIVLLDGDWGIGKTYLIENELRPIIEEQPEVFGEYHYISAFGITSVAEFLDQVVSLYISNQREGSKYLQGVTKFSDKLAQMCGADKNTAGVIQGTIAGVTGLLRQEAINRIKDITLVIDDLERLTDEKLIADIMGICLKFAEHNKLKIIAIANVKALKAESKVEKVFSDVIRLNRTTEELLNIVADIYNEKLDNTLRQALLTAFRGAEVHDLDIKNLRVIKRAINRIIKLLEKVNDIKGVDNKKSTEILAQHIVLTTLFCYTHTLNLCAFLQIGKSSQEWHKTLLEKELEIRDKTQKDDRGTVKDESKESAACKQLYYLFQTFNLEFNISLVEYCFTNVLPDLSDKDYIDRFQLPRIYHHIDIIKLSGFYSFESEEEFEKGISKVEELLFKEYRVNWDDWITCCDRYLMLQGKGYFDNTCSADVSQKLINRMHENEVINLDTVIRDRYLPWRICSEQLSTKEFQVAMAIIYERAEVYQRRQLKNVFLQNWRQTYTSHRGKIEHTPFFDIFDAKRFSDAVTKWSNWEVIEFAGLIKERYNISNQPEKDRAELSILKDLSQQLMIKRQEINGRMQRGAIFELVTELDRSVAKIEERQTRSP